MSSPAVRWGRGLAFVATAVGILPAFSCADTDGGTLVPGAGGQGLTGSSTGTSSGGGGEGAAAGGACGCLLGDGPYCEERAAAEAEAAGCQLPELPGAEGALLKCESDGWSVLESCAEGCTYSPDSSELDDACELPECECFVLEAWCGAGAALVAQEQGCQIPLLPEHNGDILYCPDGVWSVRQACPMGCVQAPSGTPDYCLSEAEYRLPFGCGQTFNCSNGNHTSSHDGKDEYAYDFAMPVGTTIRASRAGQVLRVRIVTEPGDPCYDGGGSSCANYANTVEVLHSDGTVALYMHLSSALVGEGDPVLQGTPVGLSGNTGYSTGPHLHTQIQQNCGIWWCQSIPFVYAEAGSPCCQQPVTSENCSVP